MIEVQNLSKSFKENLVLDDISVKLERGKTNFKTSLSFVFIQILGRFLSDIWKCLISFWHVFDQMMGRF